MGRASSHNIEERIDIAEPPTFVRPAHRTSVTRRHRRGAIFTEQEASSYLEAHVFLPVADDSIEQFVDGHASNFSRKGDDCGIWIAFSTDIGFAFPAFIFSWILSAQVLLLRDLQIDSATT